MDITNLSGNLIQVKFTKEEWDIIRWLVNMQNEDYDLSPQEEEILRNLQKHIPKIITD